MEDGGLLFSAESVEEDERDEARYPLTDMAMECYYLPFTIGHYCLGNHFYCFYRASDGAAQSRFFAPKESSPLDVCTHHLSRLLAGDDSSNDGSADSTPVISYW